MSGTIYATFATREDAERAAGALMDHGLRSEDVSFIFPESLGAGRVEPGAMMDEPTLAAPSEHRGATVVTPADIPAPTPEVPAPVLPAGPAVGGANRLRTGVATVHQAGRPLNPADALVEGDVENAPISAPPLAGHPTDMTPLDARPGEIAYLNPSNVPVPRTHMEAMAADAPIDVVETDRAHALDMNRQEPGAASGITTTTAADAAKGALGGAVAGIGFGLLVGLATLALPGIGFVAGTGALAAGLAAASGAAGGVAGGVYGYLSDLGIPPATAQRFSENLEAGGPVVSIALNQDVPEGEIITLLKKYGATSAQAF